MAELRRMSYSNGNQGDDNGSQNGNSAENNNNQFNLETVRGSNNQHEVGAKVGESESRGVPAVVLRKASKHFKKGVPVLENMNMTVKRGEIYSLLGSSGCGKTTTLACIVGVRKLNEGSVYVFGARPGVKGKSVGYMPQETSLYDDFSIAETLSYFGTLCGLDRQTAAEKTTFLKGLLRLPDTSQRVGTLSGGQRRRVSFATALVADPQLLVLDEPTVGVDPLLRESIWKHLVHLSIDCGTTVLITTHYIDEAKESSRVGVMRYGRLLVEQDPALLLQQFNTTSLETVVLQLCRQDNSAGQNGNNDTEGQIELSQLQQDVESPDDSDFVPSEDNENTSEQMFDSFIRVKSLIHKNLVVLFRNLLLFFFSVIMPAFIIYVMCIAFKDDPKDLNFGVVNYEVPNASICLNAVPRPAGECDIENLSCKFLKNIPPGILELVSYETEAKAAADVHKGSLWGYMIFPEDYSSFFYERSASGANVDEDVVNRSEIIVRMDQTNKNVVNKVKKSLYDGFEDYGKSILEDCGFDKRQAEFTLKYLEPIFGTEDTKFIDFVAPSITVAWLFFFPIIAASIRYINEKKQGTFERSLVAGTKTWEILFAYGCTECIVLILQSLLVYLILNVIVGIEVLGSPILVMILFLLSGFGGVSMGFFIGALCNEEIEAALLAMALFFPNCFVSGVIWPVEGMPVALQYISYALPCTLTGESMRSLFSRGWPLSHPNVWLGFVSIVGWILFYFLLTVIIQKLRSK